MCSGVQLQQLQSRGFAILPGRVPQKVVVDAKNACIERLEGLLTKVSAVGCDPLEQQYSFASICHRQKLRWDFRCLESNRQWQRLCEEALLLITPTIAPDASSQVRLVMSGCVTSRPGAVAQTFHADGNADGLFTCFVPLVDVAADADGTQFWPGSHLNAHAPTLAPTLDCDDARLEEMESPAVPAGGLLVFDYRVIHRGLASVGRERPMAYLVVARDDVAAGSLVEDTINFPDIDIADARAEDIAAFPRWQSEGPVRGRTAATIGR